MAVTSIGGDKIDTNNAKAQRFKALTEAYQQGASWDMAQWEQYLNSINPEAMELGLARVREVALRLNLIQSILDHGTKVVTVAGTNGKGSTATLLQRTLARSLNCGLYVSPHVFAINERISVNDDMISDADFCLALQAVTAAQCNSKAELSSASRPFADQIVDLTFFEILTLAAVYHFISKQCSIIILEVGLGGRLDATKIFAVPQSTIVIASIGFDHMKILGSTIEQIAFEKAGIINSACTVFLGQNISASALRVIEQQADSMGANCLLEGRDFELNDDVFCWSSKRINLPSTTLPKSSCALASAVALHLACSSDVAADLTHSIKTTHMLGRMQLVKETPHVYLDVAHNVPAAQHLVEQLLPKLACGGKRYAVMAMLADKDIEGVCKLVSPHFDRFMVGSLHNARGAEASRLANAIDGDVHSFDSVELALLSVLEQARDLDNIVVFGSFVTVSEALVALKLV